MTHITLHDGHYAVHCSPRETARMRRIPGARFNRRLDAWIVPGNLGGYAAIAASFPLDSLVVNDDVRQLNDQLMRFADKSVELHSTHEGDTPGLFSFQHAGNLSLRHTSHLLADDMGTGKTVQALVSLPPYGRVLVVCPNSIKGNWATEAREWTTRTPYVLGGGVTAAKRRKALEMIEEDDKALVIVNYESLRTLSSMASFGNVTKLTEEQAADKELNRYAWSVMIADEAHKIKEPKAQQTRCCWRLRSQAATAHALTGTPINNDADDLWAILHFIAPDEHPSRSRFRELYCDVRPGWHGGVENFGVRPEMLPFFDIVLQPRLLRRTKAEVLPDLPEKVHVVIDLDMGTAQKKAYRQMQKDSIAFLKDGSLVAATDPLTQLTRLREIASAMPLTDDGFGVDALTTPSNKLDWIIETMKQKDCLVVFAESARLIKLLATELREAGFRVGEIHQDIASQDRTRQVEEFQGGLLDIMCLTTGTGAEGITLTRADTLVFAQRSWSNAANRQAEDRIHRIGQDRGTEIITLNSVGTIDAHVMAVAAEKEVNLQQIVRDPEFLREVMS